MHDERMANVKLHAWRIAAPAVMIAAAAFAQAQTPSDPEAPNGTSPGQAVPPVTEVAPDVHAHVMGGPPAPGRKYSTTEIARSFYDADVDHDGMISREEARRLRIMPFDFDQIDRDHDGMISRFEYEDVFQ